MNQLKKAIKIATEAHKNQYRKYTGCEYITHPLSVSLIVNQHLEGINEFHREEISAVAVLHDVVEDTKYTQEFINKEFGVIIGYGVECLTKLIHPSGVTRKEKKLIEAERLGDAPEWIQLIKVADVYHNSESIIEHDPEFAEVFMNESQHLVSKLDKVKNNPLTVKMKDRIDQYYNK